MFQLYLEHLTYFWKISSVTWNAFSEIWNASSFNTIHVLVKRRIGMCLVKYAEEHQGRIKIFFISGVSCPSKGLLIDITSKHL